LDDRALMLDKSWLVGSREGLVL